MSNVVGGAPAVFGLQDFSSEALSAGGGADVQAGGHPQLDAMSLNWTTFISPSVNLPEQNDLPLLEPKTQVVDVPAGFVADTQVVGHCPISLVEGTRQPAGMQQLPSG